MFPRRRNPETTEMRVTGRFGIDLTLHYLQEWGIRHLRTGLIDRDSQLALGDKAAEATACPV